MSTTDQAAQTGVAIKGIDIAAYFVSDPARAIAFYRDVLGMTPTEVDAEGRGAEFTLADGSTFGVWNPGNGPTSGACMMFAVPDARAAVEAYRARGLTVSDVSESPVCYMAFCSDPDGNQIIIHQRKTNA
ncbi:MAG: VOC family protein [Vulcanimicrobiaceae bacterium]